jgi:alpha-ribazole phosphatase
MEVYLIRHTTPQIEKGICYGQSDIPLTELFKNESEKLLLNLPQDIDVVYSSPLSRCRKLAELIKTKGPIIPDKRLLELNFGDWEMKKWDDIEQEELNKWMQNFVNVQVPNGESFVDLNNRVNHFIDELVKKNHKRVVIITHAGVIRSFIIRILEIPLKNAFKIPVDYSSVTKVDIGVDNCFNNLKILNKNYE